MCNGGEVHLIGPVSNTQSPCIRVPTRESALENYTWLILKVKVKGAYICASGTSPDTPAPPYTCIAQSVTLQTILAAATLIMAI